MDFIREEQMLLFPGRWAIGYNTMYVLARCLNDMRPQSVLELGLGNSTKIISAYFKKEASECSRHVIVEHNQEWIRFFQKENALQDCSEIHVCPLKKKTYKGVRGIYGYAGFQKIPNVKYEIILIDGPYGTDGKYSRMDILSILPGCLADDFAIIVDDYQRKGEKNMVEELTNVLEKHSVPYAIGNYPGETECCVIASKENAFLTSL